MAFGDKNLEDVSIELEVVVVGRDLEFVRNAIKQIDEVDPLSKMPSYRMFRLKARSEGLLDLALPCGRDLSGKLVAGALVATQPPDRGVSFLC